MVELADLVVEDAMRMDLAVFWIVQPSVNHGFGGTHGSTDITPGGAHGGNLEDQVVAVLVDKDNWMLVEHHT